MNLLACALQGGRAGGVHRVREHRERHCERGGDSGEQRSALDAGLLLASVPFNVLAGLFRFDSGLFFMRVAAET